MHEDQNGRADPRRSAAVQVVPTDRAFVAPAVSYRAAVLAPPDLDAYNAAGFNFAEYWRIIWRRKWLVLSIAAAIVGLGMLRALMMTPLYTSTESTATSPKS